MNGLSATSHMDMTSPCSVSSANTLPTTASTGALSVLPPSSALLHLPQNHLESSLGSSNIHDPTASALTAAAVQWGLLGSGGHGPVDPSSVFPSSIDPFNTPIPPVLPFGHYGNSSSGFYSQQNSQMFHQDTSSPLNGVHNNNSAMASFMEKHVHDTNGGGLGGGGVQPQMGQQYYDLCNSYFTQPTFNGYYN